jgi:hypothetical protein
VADWVTISSLATAGGTLALAGATYAATRSSNRSARIAEQALQEQRRPLLVNARLDDPRQKAMFSDRHWVHTNGSQAVVEEDGGTLYLAIPLRNVGAGIAVVQGWYLWPELARSDIGHREPEEFRRQIRDIYVAPGDVALWQAALREVDADLERQFATLRAQREVFTIDLLYSDQVGGQRSISRFTISPVGDDAWLANVGLHWNLDAPSPR